jgi:hypothetical protein
VIKVLETTRAVEDFCRFDDVHEDKGFGAGKVLASGEVLMIIPPVQVVHTQSKLSGPRVSFTYGWILLTMKGTIRRAESMEVPAQGWEHVEARLRDTAYHMLDFEMDILPELVVVSEALLLAQYGGDMEQFAAARILREEDEAHYIMPRPKKDAKAIVSPHPLPSTFEMGKICEEYNPYEAFKHERHGDAGASGPGAGDISEGKCFLHLSP